MITDDPVIAQLAETNPVPDAPVGGGSADRAEFDRVLQRVLAEPARARLSRPRVGFLVPMASVLVVLAVVAIVLRTGGGSAPSRGSTSGGSTTIMLSAEPTAAVPRITAAAMSREVALVRRRLATLGGGFSVARSGATEIALTVSAAHAAERARAVRLATASAQLRFYDWEADVLTPNGKTAAAQLLAQNSAAVKISQGGGSVAGVAGAGSMSLYAAVTLASKQPETPASPSQIPSRVGAEYYMFGAPGSHACARAEAELGERTIYPTRCLLAGPLDVGSASRARAVRQLAAQLPAGVRATDGQVLAVPQGTVVLEAERADNATPVPMTSPDAQFFVLRDRVALTGNLITRPRASTDSSGEADVSFGFTGRGRADFQRVTEAIAHRGANVSIGGATLTQHFAVVLDSQLLSVPQIDFHEYPDGVVGATGADIAGGLTAQQARDLATELRLGTLPLNLRVLP